MVQFILKNRARHLLRFQCFLTLERWVGQWVNSTVCDHTIRPGPHCTGIKCRWVLLSVGQCVIVGSTCYGVIRMLWPSKWAEILKFVRYQGILCPKVVFNHSIDKPANLIIRLLFGFGSGSDSHSVFFRLNKNENRYWDGNAVSNIHLKPKKKLLSFLTWVENVLLPSTIALHCIALHHSLVIAICKDLVYSGIITIIFIVICRAA